MFGLSHRARRITISRRAPLPHVLSDHRLPSVGVRGHPLRRLILGTKVLDDHRCLSAVGCRPGQSVHRRALEWDRGEDPRRMCRQHGERRFRWRGCSTRLAADRLAFLVARRRCRTSVGPLGGARRLVGVEFGCGCSANRLMARVRCAGLLWASILQRDTCGGSVAQESSALRCSALVVPFPASPRAAADTTAI